jgi:hypothetical protein
MAFSTYAELQTSILGWLNRQDLSAVIPDFIALTEADLNDKLRVQAMVTKKTATLASDSYPLPADWLEAFSISVPAATTSRRLRLVAADELFQIRDDDDGTTPEAYAIWGGNLEFAPAHGGAVVELSYYARLPALATNSTNWLLTRRPDAYLYGALVHSAPYLVEDERAVLWAAAYQNAIDSLNNADQAARFSGAPMSRRGRN